MGWQHVVIRVTKLRGTAFLARGRFSNCSKGSPGGRGEWSNARNQPHEGFSELDGVILIILLDHKSSKKNS